VPEHGLVNGCLSVLWNAALLLRGADVLVIATSLRHLMRALGSFLRFYHMGHGYPCPLRRLA
jgi:hypothetical protein